MTLLSVAVRPAVNGYVVVATFGVAPAQGTFPAQTSSTEILFTDIGSIGTFLTAQNFVPLAAPVPGS
jgi:hypothetical protein